MSRQKTSTSTTPLGTVTIITHANVELTVSGVDKASYERLRLAVETYRGLVPVRGPRRANSPIRAQFTSEELAGLGELLQDQRPATPFRLIERTLRRGWWSWRVTKTHRVSLTPWSYRSVSFKPTCKVQL